MSESLRERALKAWLADAPPWRPPSPQVASTTPQAIELVSILDLRLESEFTRVRLTHSANVPFHALSSSLALAPERSRAFALVLDPSLDRDTQLATFERDFKGIPWNVAASFVGDDAFFALCERFGDARVQTTRDAAEPPASRRRMWSPSAPFERALDVVERAFDDDDTKSQGERGVRHRLGVANATCVDLGCGSGRDAIFAASRGWNVVAIDNDKKALARCASLAVAHGVEDRVRTLEFDFERASSEDAWRAILERSKADGWNVVVVYAVRFLHKPLMRDLKRLLAPTLGAAVIWVHFMRGCETTAVGRPSKDKDLLEVHELRDAFAEWDVVRDGASTLPDGRPVSEFVAINRAPVLNSVNDVTPRERRTFDHP